LKIKGKTYGTRKPNFLVDIEYELNHSRKLGAVKMYRDAVGCGLAEAKDMIDKFQANRNWAHLPNAHVIFAEPYINDVLNTDHKILKERYDLIPEYEAYIVAAMRTEGEHQSTETLEKIVWKYEKQYEWISDLFTLEEMKQLISNYDVV
jgi:hypothetical protein